MTSVHLYNYDRDALSVPASRYEAKQSSRHDNQFSRSPVFYPVSQISHDAPTAIAQLATTLTAVAVTTPGELLHVNHGAFT